MKSLLLIPLVFLAQLSATEIVVKHINGTTTSYTWEQLQNAIDDPDTTCGDIIEITPGAPRQANGGYTLRGPALDHAFGGPVTPPSHAKDCSSSGKYITIRSSKTYQLIPGKRVGSDDAANLALVGLALDWLSCTVIGTEWSANYWKLQGLEIPASTFNLINRPQGCAQGGAPIIRIGAQAASGDSAQSRVENMPHHIIIDQCWIHGVDGQPVRDGIYLEGISLQLINSTVENIRSNADFYDGESHAIASANGRGPLRIINNKLSAGGIHTLFGGSVSSNRRSMEDVEFSNNWLYRPFKWMDWSGTDDPTPLSPCPIDSDSHGATYRNTAAVTYWECQGAIPGTWTSISAGTYNALIVARIPYPNKNIFELKNASRWHIEGNLFDQASSLQSASQIGACILFNLLSDIADRVAYITIDNNICQHAPAGLAQGVYATSDAWWDNNGRAINHILLHNMLFQHMGEDMYTQPAFGNLSNFFRVSYLAGWGHKFGEAMTMDHITFQSEFTRGDNGTANGGIVDFAYFDPALPSWNQRITNSIWTAGKCAYFGIGIDGGCNGNGVAGAWGPYAEISANGIIDHLALGVTSDFDAMRYHCVQGTAGCRHTTAFATYPPNCLGSGGSLTSTRGTCKYDIPSNLGFTSYPNDLSLQSGSDFKHSGLDGKDIGTDLNTVGWATVGAQSGILSPYLAMKIRSIIPTDTTVAVRFSAIDSSSCTVEARIYGFPLSSPVATATINTGNLDRTTTLTGLTSNVKYGLKLTCAGSYYREDDFRTN